MTHFSRNSNGFTLVETMTAVLVLTLVWVSVPGSFVSYKYISNDSKHKIQARYVAQRILEEKRRQSFSSLVTGSYGTVSIDTKGTFSSSADDLTGSASVTVTSLDTYRKRVQVAVQWQEKTPVGVVTKIEYYTTDIANDPQIT